MWRSVLGLVLATVIISGCDSSPKGTEVPWEALPPSARTEAQKKQAEAAQRRADKLEQQVMDKYFPEKAKRAAQIK